MGRLSWIRSSITYIIYRFLFASALPTAHPKAHCLVVFERLIKVQIRGVDGLRQHLLTRLPLKTPSWGGGEGGDLPSDERQGPWTLTVIAAATCYSNTTLPFTLTSLHPPSSSPLQHRRQNMMNSPTAYLLYFSPHYESTYLTWPTCSCSRRTRYPVLPPRNRSFRARRAFQVACGNAAQRNLV